MEGWLASQSSDIIPQFHGILNSQTIVKPAETDMTFFFPETMDLYNYMCLLEGGSLLKTTNRIKVK